MYSPQFIKFLIGRDADEYTPKTQEKVEITTEKDGIFRYKRYATIPIEVKK